MNKFQDSSGVACCLDWQTASFSYNASNYNNSSISTRFTDFKRTDSLCKKTLPSKICLLQQENTYSKNQTNLGTSDLYRSMLKLTSKGTQSYWSGKLISPVNNTNRRTSSSKPVKREYDIAPVMKDRSYSSKANNIKDRNYGRNRIKHKSITPDIRRTSSQYRSKNLSPQRLKNRRYYNEHDYYEESDETSDNKKALCEKLRDYLIDICDEKEQHQRGRSSSRRIRKRNSKDRTFEKEFEKLLDKKIENKIRNFVNRHRKVIF